MTGFWSAGALSTLSPCVLPLVPLLIASAVNVAPLGAVAQGSGLALSFADHRHLSCDVWRFARPRPRHVSHPQARDPVDLGLIYSS